MLNISDITSTELQESAELDLISDSEDYLQEISEQEKDKIHGGIWVSNGCERYWIK